MVIEPSGAYAVAEEFGDSMAISGSTAVVGAPSHNSGTGAAYVLVDANGHWFQLAELTASDGAPGDAFGYTVAVSGTTVAVAAPPDPGRAGAAYVFTPAGTLWSQQAELTGFSSSDSGAPATSVAISRSATLVGRPGHNSNTGAAYAFVSG